LELAEADGSVILRVRVQPRASRDALAGERNGALVVRVTAPPVEDAANRALVRVLGEALGVAPSRVRILSGHTGRTKRVAVEGLAVDGVRARLEASEGGR